MDNKLSDILHSSVRMDKTNKALRSYAAKGINGFPVGMLGDAAAAHPSIPEHMVLPLALACANRYLNGGQITGLRHLFLTPIMQIEHLVNNPDSLYDTYRKMRCSTLLKYLRAIEIINEYQSI